MIERARACRIAASNGGKNRSREQPLAVIDRIAVAAAFADVGDEVFRRGDDARVLERSTNARPITDDRYGSSPYVSSTRPHRTSSAMLTTGDSTWRMPRLRVSRAAAAATRVISAVSHVAASAIACGNDVAPSPPKPCSASSNGMIGMPSRVFSTK